MLFMPCICGDMVASSQAFVFLQLFTRNISTVSVCPGSRPCCIFSMEHLLSPALLKLVVWWWLVSWCAFEGLRVADIFFCDIRC